ncbi:hypothetical protein VNO78_33583 [Psophocarpus tetragonolobus]|uniref:Secreted protein n=1 Tax=Psophocarpus tetragonolobus TaxID=3891 RepID=A0AAN9NX88_PSOTE
MRGCLTLVSLMVSSITYKAFMNPPSVMQAHGSSEIITFEMVPITYTYNTILIGQHDRYNGFHGIISGISKIFSRSSLQNWMCHTAVEFSRVVIQSAELVALHTTV